MLEQKFHRHNQKNLHPNKNNSKRRQVQFNFLKEETHTPFDTDLSLSSRTFHFERNHIFEFSSNSSKAHRLARMSSSERPVRNGCLIRVFHVQVRTLLPSAGDAEKEGTLSENTDISSQVHEA